MHCENQFRPAMSDQANCLVGIFCKTQIRSVFG